MTESDKNNAMGEEIAQHTAIISLLFFIVAGIFLIGPMLGSLLSLPFLGFDITALTSFVQNLGGDPSQRTAAIAFQGGTAIGAFFVAPWLWLKLVKRRNPSVYFSGGKVLPLAMFLAVALSFSMMIFNSGLIEWNKGLEFPAFMKGFEEWARNAENQADALSSFMTNFDSFGQFLVGLIVIAGLAGICEEFLFRGVLQTEIQERSGNIHVAVWVSAFLFSAIHFQFFGFFPRLVLGVVFGYLYAYSGSLWYPVFAHFLNNAFVVCSAYILGKNTSELSNVTESTPWYLVVLGLIGTVALMVWFKSLFPKKKTA
ncbi:hypothetical protein FUAX_06210 [Fulvitalea axinellae]|uniref:CAAX prenyl protease 2/Lysostaphin resistance protein A-like domain-containing protein n=1 Tax=Fulvitalea axinellae TaxID=1182444 RepID=A0AAU9C895_9BACT|nr:hypothetical protein FUAX_06210 [Fulvitalea axinellae]